MFLAALAPFMKIPHGFVVDYWNSTAKNSTASGKWTSWGSSRLENVGNGNGY